MDPHTRLMVIFWASAACKRLKVVDEHVWRLPYEAAGVSWLSVTRWMYTVLNSGPSLRKMLEFPFAVWLKSFPPHTPYSTTLSVLLTVVHVTTIEFETPEDRRIIIVTWRDITTTLILSDRQLSIIKTELSPGYEMCTCSGWVPTGGTAAIEPQRHRSSRRAIIHLIRQSHMRVTWSENRAEGVDRSRKCSHFTGYVNVTTKTFLK